jgi:hypothetical protein
MIRSSYGVYNKIRLEIILGRKDTQTIEPSSRPSPQSVLG